MTTRLFVGNDNVIELDALKDVIADTFINTASVTVTLTDANGDEIVGETWPLAMSYVGGSQGTYRATLPDTLTLTSGTTATAVVDVNGGPGLQGQWTVRLSVETRRVAQ